MLNQHNFVFILHESSTSCAHGIQFLLKVYGTIVCGNKSILIKCKCNFVWSQCSFQKNTRSADVATTFTRSLERSIEAKCEQTYVITVPDCDRKAMGAVFWHFVQHVQ